MTVRKEDNDSPGEVLVLNNAGQTSFTTNTQVGKSETYKVTSVDKYNVSSDTLTFTINKKVPSAPSISYNNAYTNQDVSVNITYPENVKKYYSIDGGEKQEYTDSILIDKNNTAIKAWYVDEIGAESEKASATVNNIDKEAPVIEITTDDTAVLKENDGVIKTSADAVTIKASDTGFGVDTMTVDGTSFVSGGDISDRGSHEIIVNDKAGNVVTKNIELVNKPTLLIQTVEDKRNSRQRFRCLL